MLDQTFPVCVGLDGGRFWCVCWRCEGKIGLDTCGTYAVVANAAVKQLMMKRDY